MNDNLNSKEDKKRQNRLKLLNYMIQSKTKPQWMTIKLLPVLPPELRPIIKLQDNTIVNSDLNYLYQNIINVNNRIEQMQKMEVSEKFKRTEKIKLQNSINMLFSEDKKGETKKRVWIKSKNKRNI